MGPNNSIEFRNEPMVYCVDEDGHFLAKLNDILNVKLDEIPETAVDRILKCGPATIVFWSDGSKTVVKRMADEPNNDHYAFCAALAKKIYGHHSAVKRMLKEKTEYQKGDYYYK